MALSSSNVHEAVDRSAWRRSGGCADYRVEPDRAAGLLVLSGAAGVGKTRLTVEHARSIADARFADVVGLKTPAEIARAVGAAIGISGPDGALIDTSARLARHLIAEAGPT